MVSSRLEKFLPVSINITCIRAQVQKMSESGETVLPRIEMNIRVQSGWQPRQNSTYEKLVIIIFYILCYDEMCQECTTTAFI